MKKLLGIVVLSLLFNTQSYSQILNLKCTFNSGFAVPQEDLSSKKGEVQFYKIDFKNKIIIDSPSGPFKNFKTERKNQYVKIDTDKIIFGYHIKNGTHSFETEINRQTGQLEESAYFNSELFKGMIKLNYLCVKTESKNKF